jgi:probable F420-dependent oxidoreductase
MTPRVHRTCIRSEFRKVAASSSHVHDLSCHDQAVRLGLHALGIGSGAERAVIDAVAIAAEAAGFATLWSGEHIVMVDEPASRYPYADDGKIAVPAAADWLDPLIGLSFAAAATTTIGIATGVLLLPEHNPVVIAKQSASLDKLSGGRFTLGVGIGWSKDEFDALGVPFQRRGARTTEYIEAIRALWRDDLASFHGEFVDFEAIRVNPKPVRGQIPIIVGGNSDAALRRVAAWADGWYGFNLGDAAEVAERITRLAGYCNAVGRDIAGLTLSVALREPTPANARSLAAVGIEELVLVEAPPQDPAQAEDWVGQLAARWMPVISGAGNPAPR